LPGLLFPAQDHLHALEEGLVEVAEGEATVPGHAHLEFAGVESAFRTQHLK
jgi:hypothetical protein